MKISVSPVHSSVNVHDTPYSWQVNELPAYFECKADGTEWPRGWVIVKSLMLRQCTGYETRLVLQLKGGKTVVHDLPVTLKGKIFEVVYFPKDVVKVFFEPMSSKGRFQLQDFEFKSVPWVVRNYFMYRRLYSLFKSQKPDVIFKAGIRWHQFYFNLTKAYQIAGRFRSYSPKIEYSEWLRLFDRVNQNDKNKIKKLINRFKKLPKIDVIPLHDDDNLSADFFAKRILKEQVYKNYRVVERGDLKSFSAQWVLLVDQSVRLHPHALFWFAYEAIKNPDAAFVYSDHDYLNDEAVRVDPQFKPEWSPELFLSQNFVGNAILINCNIVDLNVDHNSTVQSAIFSVFEKLKPFKSDGFNVVRIPSLLYSEIDHRNSSVSRARFEKEFLELNSYFKKKAIPAHVVSLQERYRNIHYKVVDSPLVSIVIPTRNMLKLLKGCVSSLLKKTDYQNYEIVVVDNQSDDKATLDYLAELEHHEKIQVVKYDAPFNYSKINNFTVDYCNGEYLCLLNNDTEVISSNWLDVMLGQLQQSNVGAVGIKLLYPNRTVQHAGDAVGPGGCADHFFSGYEEDEPGYMGRAIVAQDLSAVTAACLLTPTKLYTELGGLDEANLEVAFNDVDYCLRVREAGYRVVFTPYAKMFHHESVSRGQDLTPEKIERAKFEADYIRERWSKVINNDPFYNPNLNYARPNFELSRYPMVKKPWLKR